MTLASRSDWTSLTSGKKQRPRPRLGRGLALLLAGALTAAFPAFQGSLPVSSAAELPTAGTLVGKIVLTNRRKGNEGTIVYLRGIQGNFQPAQKMAAIDQKRKVFMPHVLPVQKGATVRFFNSDPFTHNAHVYWDAHSMYNQAQPPQGSSDWTPPRTGEYVVLCNIHPEMSAFLVVLDHPFFALVVASEFKIENIPVGTYTLVAVRDVRGELKGQETQVTIKSGETTSVALKF